MKQPKKRWIPPEGARRSLALALAVTLLFTGVITYMSRAWANTPIDQIYSLLAGTIETPETVEDYSELASIAIGRLEYDIALDHLESARSLLSQGEDDPAAMSRLWVTSGSVYALQGEYDLAIDCLAHSIQCDPKNAQALLLRGQIALALGEYDASAKDLRDYLALVPEDSENALTLAQVYEALGDFTGAKQVYLDVYALAPDDAYWLNAMRCQFLEGLYEETIVAFDAYLAGLEAQPETPVAGADVQEETAAIDATETPDATETNTPVATEAPDATVSPLTAPEGTPRADETTDAAYVSTAYFLRADCLMLLARYDEAVEGFQDALDNGYDVALCHEQMVACYYESAQYDNVIASGEAMLAAGENVVAGDLLRQRLGSAYLQKEQYDKAETHLIESIALNPDIVGTYYYLGLCRMLSGRYEEAIADFTASVEQNFLPQYCYYNRGVCRVNLLAYDEAIEDFGLTLAATTDESLIAATKDVLWQLASYYESLGSVPTAEADD